MYRAACELTDIGELDRLYALEPEITCGESTTSDPPALDSGTE
jgi:hypothetical protein